jgi:hypothetical protein
MFAFVISFDVRLSVKRSVTFWITKIGSLAATGIVLFAIWFWTEASFFFSGYLGIFPGVKAAGTLS